MNCPQINECEMGWTCSTHAGNEKSVHSFSRKSWREETLGDLNVYGRIVLRRSGVVVWTGSIWLSIGTSGPSCPIKGCEFLDQLSDYQFLWCVGFFTWWYVVRISHGLWGVITEDLHDFTYTLLIRPIKFKPPPYRFMSHNLSPHYTTCVFGTASLNKPTHRQENMSHFRVGWDRIPTGGGRDLSYVGSYVI
jgi:hypothetical protein